MNLTASGLLRPGKLVLLSFLGIILLGFHNVTYAANYSWDISGSGGFQAGSGTWGTNNYWTTNGTTLGSWPGAGNSATFAGSDGTWAITVNGTQNVDSITFLNSQYTLSSGTINYGTKNGLFIASGKEATINSVISGSAGLKLYSSSTSLATLNLNGANSYTGVTKIGPHVRLNVSSMADGGLNSNIGASSFDAANLVIDGGQYRSTGGNASTDRLFTLTENGGYIFASGSGAVNFTNTGAIAFSGSGARVLELGGTAQVNSSFSPVIGDGTGGATSVKKTGDPNWSLNGANTFTGGVTVVVGILKAGNAQAFGNFDNSITVNSGCAIDVNGYGLSGYTQNIVLNGQVDANTGALINTGADQLNAIRQISLESNTFIGNNGGRFDIGRGQAGAVGITGNNYTLTKVGTNFVALGADANSLSEVIINAGTLQLESAASAGNAPITINSGATLSLLNSITYPNSITMSGGTLTSSTVPSNNPVYSGALTISGANTLNNAAANVLTISGVINGAGSLIKTGETGTVILANNNNYTGGTTITSGTLNVTGSLAAGSAVTVTGTLAGSGTVAGTVNASDGKIAPGNGGAGTLSTGNLTLSGTSTLEFELGTSSDKIAVTGNLTLDGTLNISALAGFAAGNYTLITCTGNLTDNGLSIGTTPAGQVYTITAADNTVILTVSGLSAPTDISLSRDTVLEGQSVGTFVGTLTADDADTDKDSLIYSLVSGDSSTDNSQFTITGDSLLTNVILDYGIKNSLQIRIQADDQNGGIYSKEFIIHVVASILPRPPNNAELTVGTVTPTQVQLNWTIPPLDSIDSVRIWYGTEVVPLKYDIDGNLFTSILFPANQTSTLITGLSQLTTYYFGLQVQRDGLWSYITDLSSKSAQTISGLNPPTDISLSGNTVSGSKPVGTFVGTLTAIDSDTDKDSLAYTLVTGDSATHNSQFIISGDSLFTGAILDFKTENTLQIRIQVDDGNGGIYSEGFIIHVVAPIPSNNAELTVGTVTPTQVELSWTIPSLDSIDSVRIWYGTKVVPLENDIDENLFTSVSFPAIQTSTVIPGLSQLTTYYFGLQVQRNGMWSLITEPSSKSAKTPEIIDSIVVPNRIKLIKPTYDEATNKIQIEWTIDTAGIGHLSLETGITWGTSTFPRNEPTPNFGRILSVKNPGQPDSYTLDLGQELSFNQQYYFVLWLRKVDGNWAAPTDSSKDSLFIPPANWQAISYFKSVDTVYALNQSISLWKSETWSSGVGTIYDTLDIVTPGPIPSGLIPLSMIVDFRKDYNSPPLNLGIRPDSIPAGFTLSDVNLYEFDSGSGRWLVVNRSGVDNTRNYIYAQLKTSEHRFPFTLMIDTQQPVISFGPDTSSAVQPMGVLNIPMIITDNIANVEIELWASRGADKPAMINKKVCAGYSDTGNYLIPAELITEDNGVRAFLKISDGRFTQKIDVSRSVRRSASDPVMTAEETWMPLSSTAVLSETSVEKVLNELAVNGTWTYDPVQFLLYRWISYSGNLTDSVKWVEYSDSPDIKKLFDFTPGRVFWIKTRNAVTLDLGEGWTTSLRQPCDFELKANDWTDIALPFRFSIRIGDILEATGLASSEIDSVWFFSWVFNEQKKRMISSPLHLPLIPDKNQPGADLEYGSAKAFTIYNNLDRDITLKVPPIPVSMSTFPPSYLSKENRSQGWSISLNAETEKEILSPVYFAYTPGTGKTFLPSAPDFNKMKIRVLNPENGRLFGHMVTHELPGDGYAFPLVFENTGSGFPATVNYSFDRGKYTPEQIRVVVYDPQSSSIDNSGKISVDEGAREYRYVLAGSDEFIKGWKENFTPYRLSLSRIYPNPCRGSLTIGFTAPYSGIKTVVLAVYDQLGRTVWKKEIRNELKPGLNSVKWNLAPWKLATGTYILNLTAYSPSGKITGNAQTRIMYIK